MESTITEPPAEGESDARVSASVATVLSWMMVGFVNALAIALQPSSGVGIRVRHHLYDLGCTCALGLVSWLAITAWQRWKHKWIGGPDVALAVVAVAIGFLLLPHDLSGFAQRRLPANIRGIGQAGLVIGVALGVVGARRLGLLLHDPGSRRIAAIAGLGAVFANHYVLQQDYPGAHFFLVWAGATLFAATVVDIAEPASVTSAKGWLEADRARAGALPWVIGFAGLAAIAIRPSVEVETAILRSDGTVLYPFVAATRAKIMGAVDRVVTPVEKGAALHGIHSAWSENRIAAPVIPASSPRLIAENAIVILLTIDALRADVVMSASHDELLPGLAKMRKQSVCFDVARTPSPSTTTSLTSLFTGKVYSQLYWSPFETGKWKGKILPHNDRSPRFPGLLSKAGVRTVHALGLTGLSAKAGVGVGFDEELFAPRNYASAGEVMEVIRKRLTKKTVGPLFIYAHFVDPHAPYKAGRKSDPPFLRYLGEVKKVDRQLVGLMGHLDAMELTTRTMLIVSADHGEAFGEHNTHYHSKTVYEEALRVPLMVRARRLKPATVSEPVTLLDLGPTILDLFGVAAPGNTLGQSLVPLLRGETIALTRPIVVDSGRRQQALFFSDNHKAIMDLHKGTTAVFDLAADPGERKNLASSAGKLHLRTMKQFFALHRLRRPGYTPPRRRF